MTYTYEATITEQDGGWFVSFPSFPGAYSFGSTVKEACDGAAESLRLTIAEHIDTGLQLPSSSIDTKPEAVFCVEVSDSFISESKCMTVTEAAQELGVTLGRVAQLLDAGLLEPYQFGGQRLVTIASVNARKQSSPRRGRPRKSNG